MAPAAQAKKGGKKPANNINNTTVPGFSPSRQLTRTPPPPEGRAIAGTPLIQPENNAPKATSPSNVNKLSSSIYDETIAIQKALDTLNTALNHLNALCEEAGKKITQGTDESTMNIMQSQCCEVVPF
jgi:hypothetical protein